MMPGPQVDQLDRIHPFDRFDTEVHRVCDRLAHLPIARLDAVADTVRHACAGLLACTAELGDPAPIPLPGLRPDALADQVTVLCADLRTAAQRAATQTTPAALETATALLFELRRSI